MLAIRYLLSLFESGLLLAAQFESRCDDVDLDRRDRQHCWNEASKSRVLPSMQFMIAARDSSRHSYLLPK